MLGGVFGSRLRGIRQAFPGILHFMVVTKLENTVRAARDVDVFVLALILNVETVGLYKIARQIAALTGKVGEIAYTIIYPELSRLSAAEDRKSPRLNSSH